MNTRKKILVAFLAAVGTPLVAAAATPVEWYAPLSYRAGDAKVESTYGADNSGTPVSYPLLSYDLAAKHETAQKSAAVQSAQSADDTVSSTSYPLLSYGANHRG